MKARALRSRGTITLVTAFLLGGAVNCSETTSPSLPNPPDNVSVALASKGQIEVKWAARPKAEQIVSYGVYRDGLKIGDSQTLSFVDSTAPQSATHVYNVSSQSAAGVVSELSVAASIFAPDATPPRVLSATPVDGAVNVSATPLVQVTFSEPMDSASITSSTVTMKDAASGAVLPGIVSYARNTRIATWSASPPLPSERRVITTVTTGVKDVAGNPLAAAHSFAFTVRETVPPVVLEFTPPNGATIPMGTFPTVRFSERMGDLTGLRWIDSTSQSVLTTALLADTITNVVTVRPASRVRSLVPYTISIDERALDRAGNPTTSIMKFTFRYGEWSLPNIVSRFPANGATGVPVSVVMSVELDAPILPVNDYEPRFNIRQTGSSTTLPSFMVFRTFDNQYTLTPTPALQPNTDYTVVFYHFFTDSKGERHEAESVWSFRTGN
ncbi:MAG: Ig-like domain-containing protein [Gemmatimonadaceae bacterium]|nr:Ig-like domain-containing protein [Gemmatimonadaceae bacterium]